MALAFDPDNYRQRLNLALSLPNSVGSNGSALAGDDPNAGELPDAAVPDQASAQQPQNLRLADDSSGGGAMDDEKQEDPGTADDSSDDGKAGAGPKSADTSRPFDHHLTAKTSLPPPKFDASKLKGAQTVEDITDAIKPKQLNRYMDWWETQYGQINKKYDEMQQRVGIPPDEDRAPSRKEKFDALMHFGLNLMRASQPDQHGGKGGGDFLGAFGQAAGETMEGHLQQRRQEVLQNQQQHQDIETQRQSALRGIGNQGQAMVASSKLALTDAQTTEALDRAKNLEAPDRANVDQVLDTEQGPYALMKDGSKKLLTDAKGQPLKIKGTFGRGSGTNKDQRTANEKNIDDLVKRGLPQDLATSLVYKQIRDPRAAWQQIYRAHITKDATPKEAKAEADNVIEELYGANAISNAKSGLGMGSGNDPLGILGRK